MLEVEEKVTTFWQNIHPDKFDPYSNSSLLVIQSKCLLSMALEQHSYSIFKKKILALADSQPSNSEGLPGGEVTVIHYSFE